MIKVTIYRGSDESPKGFELNGHAGFGEYGTDIVCAGVSVLAQNTVNSIEAFTEDDFTVDAKEEDGYLKVSFPNEISAESELFMKSFILGIESLIKSGNDKYIRIKFKEV